MTEEILNQILQRIERIENFQSEILEEIKTNGNGQNNTPQQQEIKETKQLMQDIVKYYKDNLNVEVQIGSKLHIFRFRDTLARVKNIKNSKLENRRLMKYIRKLEEYQFIRRDNAETIEVLDLGIDWSEL